MKTRKNFRPQLAAVLGLSLIAGASFADPLQLPSLSIPAIELPELSIDVTLPSPDFDALWSDTSAVPEAVPVADVSVAEEE